MKTHTYLNFDGQTRDAFAYYGKIFGVEPEVITYDAFPMEGMEVPSGKGGHVMHASLALDGGDRIMGSDPLPEFGHVVKMGNNVHISLNVDDKAEADRLFAALSEGGSVVMPIGDMPWGDYWGNCTDRFGVQWMINVPGTPPE